PWSPNAIISPSADMIGTSEPSSHETSRATEAPGDLATINHSTSSRVTSQRPPRTSYMVSRPGLGSTFCDFSPGCHRRIWYGLPDAAEKKSDRSSVDQANP